MVPWTGVQFILVVSITLTWFARGHNVPAPGAAARKANPLFDISHCRTVFYHFLDFSPQFCRRAIFFPAFDFKYQILFAFPQKNAATLR
jgi:hypothetical protein